MGSGLDVSPLAAAVEVDCPLCGQRHVADAVDHGEEIEWTVGCGGLEARMRAPRVWLLAAEAEILTTVRQELAQRLALPPPSAFPAGTGPSPVVPRGLGAIVLALKLPRGSKVDVEGDCWIFRSPDGAEVRLREPFDDPATLAAAIEAGRTRS